MHPAYFDLLHPLRTDTLVVPGDSRVAAWSNSSNEDLTGNPDQLHREGVVLADVANATDALMMDLGAGNELLVLGTARLLQATEFPRLGMTVVTLVMQPPAVTLVERIMAQDNEPVRPNVPFPQCGALWRGVLADFDHDGQVDVATLGVTSDPDAFVLCAWAIGVDPQRTLLRMQAVSARALPKDVNVPVSQASGLLRAQDLDGDGQPDLLWTTRAGPADDPALFAVRSTPPPTAAYIAVGVHGQLGDYYEPNLRDPLADFLDMTPPALFDGLNAAALAAGQVNAERRPVEGQPDLDTLTFRGLAGDWGLGTSRGARESAVGRAAAVGSMFVRVPGVSCIHLGKDLPHQIPGLLWLYRGDDAVVQDPLFGAGTEPLQWWLQNVYWAIMGPVCDATLPATLDDPGSV